MCEVIFQLTLELVKSGPVLEDPWNSEYSVWQILNFVNNDNENFVIELILMFGKSWVTEVRYHIGKSHFRRWLIRMRDTEEDWQSVNYDRVDLHLPEMQKTSETGGLLWLPINEENRLNLLKAFSRLI